MTKTFGLLLAGILTTFASIASAQSTYVQIEAKRTLAEAEAAARTYAQDFPFVAAFSLPSGWYAIALGPFDEGEAQQRLYALLSAGDIPQDSFLADQSRFAAKVWPEGDTPLAPPAETTSEAVAAVDPDLARLPDETRAEARASEAALDEEARKLLQTALAFEGVYAAEIDGDFGPGTRKSMAAWQEARGYEATGVLTTRQRAELITFYTETMDSLGMTTTRDNSAGIELELPMALVARGTIEPPFATYDAKDNSGVRVLLISQSGDKATLFGLYDILQTLEIIPLEGERSKDDTSFVITGKSDSALAHAEARLTDDGAIKGFILLWPEGDERRFSIALKAMQTSFTPLENTVLPDIVGTGTGVQDPDLLSGLEIRRPDIVRSGFYVDAAGLVLTSTDVTDNCPRLSLEDGMLAQVVASDAALGLALVKTNSGPLAPLGFAHFRTSSPRLQSEVAVSGYAYDGRLGAPVLTFGHLLDIKGLAGETGLERLSLTATPSDAGGPMFDTSGAVFGLLLPAATDGQKILPADVAFARDGSEITRFLESAGVSVTLAEAGTGDLAPELLTVQARDMTVRVACWK